MEQRYDRMKLQMSELVFSSSRITPPPSSPRFSPPEDEEAAGRAARATDKRCMNIVQSMGQSLHVLDCNYRVVYWGVNSVKLFGYTRREAIGESIIDLAIGEEDRAAARSIISKVYRGERWTGLFPCRNKWGDKLLILATNTPLYDDCGVLVGEVCMASDSQSFEQVLVPMVNENTQVESRLSKVRNKPSSRPHIDPQQPQQAAITNLASRISSKVWSTIRTICTRERKHERVDDNINHSSHYLSTTTFRAGDTSLGRVRPSSLYGEFSKLQPDRKLHGNLFRDFDDETVLASSSQKRVFSEKELLFGNKGYIIPCVDINHDFADYEISWEHLTLGAQIGQGSCGTVYHAQWYGSDVAVKVFSNQEFSDHMISSFRKELSLMKRQRHPNILLFMGAVTAGSNLCIVTEYLPRGSLFGILRKRAMKLDWRRRVNMAMDIAQGMNYLHHNNPPVVHRDLKSSNLLVDKNWNVKVGDFGLSRVKLKTYLMTNTGKGTPQWMAPESLRHEPSDEKSDIYSYGVILWELATGNVPWGDLNPMQVIGVVGFKDQRLEIPTDMEPQWASLIKSCWHSDPRSRPTFLEILQILRHFQRQFAA